MMRSYRKVVGLSVMIGVIVSGTIFTNSCVHQPYVLPVDQRTGDPDICFERDILPIFQSNCAMAGCHDASSRKEGYALDNYANIVRRGIVPGNPSASSIYESITTYTGEKFMPRVGPALPDYSISLIKRWIAGGAIDSGSACSTTLCDTDSYTYSGTIKPLMQKYCFGCHYNAPSNFADYNTVKDRVLNGDLINDISHTPGYQAMPQNGAKLLDCQITQVKKWAAAGALNN